MSMCLRFYHKGTKKVLTMPWKKHIAMHATFDEFLKSPSGMSGYFASFFSLKMKTPIIIAPKTIRQMTVGDFQSKTVPPKSSPNNNISITPSIERLPNQSMALNPSTIAVFGLWTSKNRRSSKNVVPVMGRLIHQQKRHETLSVNAPPIKGPAPPAIPHITSVRAI
jgi:hypothetical protein